MAKNKQNAGELSGSESTPQAKPAKKTPGGGAVVGSIFLFLFTCIFGILLLCSVILNATLAQGKVTEAVSKMDLSQMELSDDGTTQKLGSCLYDWYFWDAPGLSEAYADAFAASPDVNDFVCNYIDDLTAYLTRETDTLPELDVNAVADLMQYDISSAMEQETGCTFAEADRQSVLWTMGDDLQDWNADLQEGIGSGFGKFAARLLCTTSGMITFGCITLALFLLWLILAIHGHWRKGRMLTGFGFAVAIPSLLVLLASGLLLLFVNGFHWISALAFTEEGLPTLLTPVVLSSLTIALCGLIPASIGICTNSVVKSRRKKKLAAAPKESAPTEPAPAPAAVPVPEVVTPEPEFVYSEAPAPQPAAPAASAAPVTPAASPSASICPRCGAENAAGSKFCGSCGQSM